MVLYQLDSSLSKEGTSPFMLSLL